MNMPSSATPPFSSHSDSVRARRGRGDSGAYVVMTPVIIIVLLFVLGMVVDGGRYFYAKQVGARSADLAVLRAAHEYFNRGRSAEESNDLGATVAALNTTSAKLEEIPGGTRIEVGPGPDGMLRAAASTSVRAPVFFLRFLGQKFASAEAGSEAQRPPIAFVLILDRTDATDLPVLKEAAKAIVSKLTPNLDYFALISVMNVPEVDFPLRRDFSPSFINELIDNLPAAPYQSGFDRGNLYGATYLAGLQLWGDPALQLSKPSADFAAQFRTKYPVLYQDLMVDGVREGLYSEGSAELIGSMEIAKFVVSLVGSNPQLSERPGERQMSPSISNLYWASYAKAELASRDPELAARFEDFALPHWVDRPTEQIRNEYTVQGEQLSAYEYFRNLDFDRKFHRYLEYKRSQGAMQYLPPNYQVMYLANYNVPMKGDPVWSKTELDYKPSERPSCDGAFKLSGTNDNLFIWSQSNSYQAGGWLSTPFGQLDYSESDWCYANEPFRCDTLPDLEKQKCRENSYTLTHAQADDMRETMDNLTFASIGAGEVDDDGLPYSAEGKELELNASFFARYVNQPTHPMAIDYTFNDTVPQSVCRAFNGLLKGAITEYAYYYKDWQPTASFLGFFTSWESANKDYNTFADTDCLITLELKSFEKLQQEGKNRGVFITAEDGPAALKAVDEVFNLVKVKLTT